MPGFSAGDATVAGVRLYLVRHTLAKPLSSGQTEPTLAPLELLDRFAAPVGGMYAATYIGGSANLTAVALHYGVTDEPALFAATNVADGVVGTLWLAALIVLARPIHRLLGTRREPTGQGAMAIEDQRPVTLGGIGVLLALPFGGFWFSQRLSEWMARLGGELPVILILTTLALLVAQAPAVSRLGGARTLGAFGSYLFIAVIGASCDFEALAGLGRMDLLLPGILVGSLGNAIGTYAGFVMAWWLQSAPPLVSDAHAVPPPPVQTVADCDRPTYASDQLVCADAALRALDHELRDLLATVELPSRVAPASLVEPQEAWSRRRSLCAFSETHAACLKTAYSERIALLAMVDPAAAAATRGTEAATCDNAPWGSADVLVRRKDRHTATVMDMQARVLAVGFAAVRGNDWSPFVRITTRGATIRLTTLDGPVVECRIRPAD